MKADEDGDIFLISWALGLEREQPEQHLAQRAEGAGQGGVAPEEAA
jgi:hypothetical protein